ncbi:MAG: PadR family transcriptional regulator [Kosmotogaceae bacterium]
MNNSRLISEMNRGFIQLLMLVMLEKPKYGYEIVKELQEKDFTIEENTLYPLLRRLEEKELLSSEWRVEENKPRKYYYVSKKGINVRKELLDIWESQRKLLRDFEEGKDYENA